MMTTIITAMQSLILPAGVKPAGSAIRSAAEVDVMVAPRERRGLDEGAAHERGYWLAIQVSGTVALASITATTNSRCNCCNTFDGHHRQSPMDSKLETRRLRYF